MPDLRALAIAAASESGNKSPRLAALLMKLAACADCQPASGPIGFFGAVAAGAITGSANFLFPGYGPTPVAAPAPAIVIPSPIRISNFSVKHIGTAQAPNLVTYQLHRNALLLATVTLNANASGAANISFPPVQLNLDDDIYVSVSPAATLGPTDVVNIRASFS